MTKMRFTDEFMAEAVKQVIERDSPVAEARHPKRPRTLPGGKGKVRFHAGPQP